MNIFELLTYAYIDVNLLLAIALGAWLALGLGLKASGLSSEHASRQRLLRLGFLAALFTPFAAHALAWSPLREAGALLSSLSLSDYVIIQYFEGRIALDSSEIEALVGARQRLADGLGFSGGELGRALTLVLAVGALVCGLDLLRSLLRLRRTLAGCHAWRRCGRLRLVLSDEIAVPFATRGLRAGYIVLPTAMLCDRSALRFAIAHEAQHLRNGDVLWEFLLEALKPLFFWNPAFAIWKAQGQRLRELACDEAVLRHKRFEARDYGGFLIRVSQQARRAPQAAALATPAIVSRPRGLSPFGRRPERILRERVLALLEGSRARPRASVVSVAGPILTAVVVLAAIWIQQPPSVSADRLHLSTIANQMRLIEIRKEPGYNLVMAY